MNTKIKLTRWLRLLLPRIVRHWGYVMIPITEIERMESDAENYYLAMKRKPYVTKSAKAYLNGIADYSSKTAHRLREKSLPSDQALQSLTQTTL